MAEGGGAKGRVEVVEPSQVELGYARRVAESKATIPHTYLEAEAPGADRPLEEVIEASAATLRESPKLNAAYRDGRFELYERINIGVAVHAQETTLLPTIFDADSKPADEIADELAALTDRARDASITQPELSGATFSMADFRPLGIARSAPVIRTGQAASLAIGTTASALVLSLACDARILQGAEAAAFLAALRERLGG